MYQLLTSRQNQKQHYKHGNTYCEVFLECEGWKTLQTWNLSVREVWGKKESSCLRGMAQLWSDAEARRLNQITHWGFFCGLLI
jgi:hypothetical protein